MIRLIGSHRGRLPNWLLVVSVVMDMGLLMALIWSFHIQYMQPASFYLKAPTMIYVFIFIALRALRCEPRFILISAAAAALGIQDITNSRTFGKGAILKTQCGINTGDIIVAVGTANRLVFTVHGDNVNIAARLEPLNKEYGTYILAGETTVKACSDTCEFEPVG